MRTLRLLKPWHLQTICQRLQDTEEYSVNEPERIVPMCGPAGDPSEVLNSRYYTPERTSVSAFADIRQHERAPISDVIYVPTYVIRQR